MSKFDYEDNFYDYEEEYEYEEYDEEIKFDFQKQKTDSFGCGKKECFAFIPVRVICKADKPKPIPKPCPKPYNPCQPKPHSPKDTYKPY